ncbi:MAG: XisH family protein [Cyanobacteriota bacterium]|nr:XisH family protein [Cyanobacteriota bacterium]
MPAKDIYHDPVKVALEKDGWIITDDPLVLQWGGKDLFVDLGAEKIIADRKNGKKIAVEIKSFIGASQINDLEKAIGQYILYRNIPEVTESKRELDLAVTKKAFEDIFIEPIGNLVLTKNKLFLLVFDIGKQEIIQWIS